MEILALKLKSKRNTNHFVVETSEGEFLLHADVIVKNHIGKGTINDNIFYEAVKESANLICFEVASKYLTSAVKTEKQLKDYLYKKDFKTEAINYATSKLKEYGIINDENFAISYIKSNPSFSKEKLKQKLLSFGVKNFDVTEVVNEEQENENCLNNATKFLKNKLPTKEVYEKLIRHLQSKGFRWESIKHCLNKLKLDVEE